MTSGDEHTDDVRQRRPLWKYPFPMLMLLVLLSGVVHPAGSIVETFPIALVGMTIWMAWSIVSGAYPWSMRMWKTAN